MMGPMSNRPSHYRAWIYSVIAILLVLVVIFATVASGIIHQPRFRLFPLSVAESYAVFLYVGCGLQLAVLALGFFAVLRSHSLALRLFWIGMVICLVFDVCIGIVCALQLWHVHENFLIHAQASAPQQRVNDTDGLCALWDSVQSEFHCCGVGRRIIKHTQICTENTEQLSASCCPLSDDGANVTCNSTGAYQDECSIPLLKWLNHEADKLFIIGFCCLFSLKGIFVLILRREMQELLDEIHHARYKNRFRQLWAAETEHQQRNSQDRHDGVIMVDDTSFGSYFSTSTTPRQSIGSNDSNANSSSNSNNDNNNKPAVRERRNSSDGRFVVYDTQTHHSNGKERRNSVPPIIEWTEPTDEENDSLLYPPIAELEEMQTAETSDDDGHKLFPRCNSADRELQAAKPMTLGSKRRKSNSTSHLSSGRDITSYDDIHLQRRFCYLLNSDRPLSSRSTPSEKHNSPKFAQSTDKLRLSTSGEILRVPNGRNVRFTPSVIDRDIHKQSE